MTGEYPMHPATANLCHGYLEERETAQPRPTTTTTTTTTITTTTTTTTTTSTTTAADATSTATTTNTTTTITTTTTIITTTTTCVFLVCRVAWPLFQWGLRYGELSSFSNTAAFLLLVFLALGGFPWIFRVFPQF